MQFQFIELHVQHAISETRLHVRSSNCMFICELHVEHAVRCTIRWMMINSNNKMHVERVWCFRICTSHNNLHVEHVILFLSDMHIEVSYMHFRHADTRYWMHVGHHIVKSKIKTNMRMLFYSAHRHGVVCPSTLMKADVWKGFGVYYGLKQHSTWGDVLPVQVRDVHRGWTVLEVVPVFSSACQWPRCLARPGGRRRPPPVVRTERWEWDTKRNLHVCVQKYAHK